MSTTETTTDPGRPAPTSTAERILDAGIRLWDLEGISLLSGGLTVARISNEAGVTRSTFYSYWPSVDDYLIDLVDHLGRRYHPGRLDEMAGHVVAESIIGDTVTRFLDACREHFLLTVDDPTSRLRLGLMAMHDDRTTERLATVMRDSEAELDVRYDQVRRTWGRVMRDPIGADHLQVVFTALIDGLALRRRIDPDAVPDDLYGLVAMCLMIFITRRADDPRDLMALFDTVNGWPVTGAQLQARLARDDPFEHLALEPSSTREITIAARRLIARSGWVELSMADISAVTGVPEMSLLGLFGSKAGLALAVLRLAMEDRFRDIPPQDEAIDELRALLHAAGEEMDRLPAVAQSVLSLIIGSSTAPRPAAIDWDPEGRVDAVIARAIAQGTLAVDDPGALRRLAMRLLLLGTTPGLAGVPGGLDPVEVLLVGSGAPPRPIDG